jgi:hypothetical protein
MTPPTSRFSVASALALSFVLALSVSPLLAEAPQAQRRQTPARPPAAPRQPAQPQTPPVAAAKPAEPAPPPKPVAQDLRMKTVYTTGEQKTESVTYQKGERERFEFGDIVLLKQHDLKRTVQIMRAANMYMLVSDGAAAVAAIPPAAPAAPQKTGVITVTTTITDTGERKTVFGLQARHVTTVFDKQPGPGACDSSKQHIQTDGWYVDLPVAAQAPQDITQQPMPAGCLDEFKNTVNGDVNILGFPISYSTASIGDDGKPAAAAMEITELEITNLDPALFDIPPGLREAGSLQALSQALSDANEAKLAQELTASTPSVEKTPGAVLVGVPEVVNKTTQQVDTRALRGRLVSELAEAKLTASPLAGSQADLARLAGAHGYDYVLVAEVTDLKVSKGGGLGGVLKAASKVAGTSSGQDPTEAAVTIKLVQPDGKARLSTTVKGKDGGGLDLKTGLGIAKFAGTMYLNMMTGKMLMNAFNQSMTGNLGGMGMLGNPELMAMQTRGLGLSGGMRMGIDPTAGAASFLMQQAMLSSATLSGGLPGQGGPSFDAALTEAMQQAAKSVSENLKKAEPKKN